MATDNIPRRRRWRLLLLAGVLGTCFALLLCAWLLHDRHTGQDDLNNGIAAGVLDDYVPEDSAAVLAIDVRQLRESPIGQKHLRPFLQQAAGLAERHLPWLKPTGINPLDDPDSLRISFGLKDKGEPLLLARGRLERSRLQIGPDALQETTLDSFHALEYRERSGERTIFLVPAGDMLLVGAARNRVQAALKQARDPQPIHLQDATLNELLTKVDRQQSLWFAVSIKSLGSISDIDNYLLKLLLRPLVAHAESVYGGISCAEDMRAELHFNSTTEEDAAQLESELKSLCEAAPGFALLNRKNEMLPLLRLLASGQIDREGKNIRLRCRLMRDHLED